MQSSFRCFYAFHAQKKKVTCQQLSMMLRRKRRILKQQPIRILIFQIGN